MEILAIVPARSGSKGLVHKNIRTIDGKPMIAYSIGHALDSQLITRVIVSTDSEQYMEISRDYGAETPFIRPAEFARDESLDIDVFYHALSWLRDNEGYIPDICVQLRPCGPVRDPEIMDRIIQCLIDNPTLDSIRAVSRATEIPYKMWHLSDDDKRLSPIMKDIPECYNMPRQKLPDTFFQNGYVDAVRPRVVLEQRSMTGNSIGGYVIDEYFDIDYPEDVLLAESCLKIRTEKRTFLVDVDRILLDENENPIRENLSMLSRLTNAGHQVYIRCREESKKEILAKLGSPKVDGIVTGFLETDYYISSKSITMTELQKIMKSSV